MPGEGGGWGDPACPQCRRCCNTFLSLSGFSQSAHAFDDEDDDPDADANADDDGGGDVADDDNDSGGDVADEKTCLRG